MRPPSASAWVLGACCASWIRPARCWLQAARRCAASARHSAQTALRCRGASSLACPVRCCAAARGTASLWFPSPAPSGRPTCCAICCARISVPNNTPSKGQADGSAPPRDHHGRPGRHRPRDHRQGRRRVRPRIEAGDLRLVVIGSNAALEQARTRFAPDLAIPEATEDQADWPALCALQAGPEGDPIQPGQLSADGGRFAFQAVERAVRLAQAGRIGGIVTAPLNKEALNKAGYHYPGHTEMLAELTGVTGSCMMLAHGNMRVSHLTTHIALEDVPKRVTPDRLRRVIALTHDALTRLGIGRARIAVAALNPHAGEGGLFGRHDIDVAAPVIAEAAKAGRDVVGPVPGDTVFVKLHAGQYDAVIANYHDQGHIPVKLL